MIKKYANTLILINAISALLIIAILIFPSTILRIVLGLPFLLFFPGYTLLMSLFPRAEQLQGIERTALSFGLSIAIVPLTGFLMNLTPWGIQLKAVLVSISFLILAFSVIAWYRRRKLGEHERFNISINWSLSWWRGLNSLSKWLSVVLLVAVTGTVAGAFGCW